jgi:hypothetical protein
LEDQLNNKNTSQQFEAMQNSLNANAQIQRQQQELQQKKHEQHQLLQKQLQLQQQKIQQQQQQLLMHQQEQQQKQLLLSQKTMLNSIHSSKSPSRHVPTILTETIPKNELYSNGNGSLNRTAKTSSNTGLNDS